MENVDRLEGLGTCAAEEFLDLGGGDEQAVEGGLDGGEATEDDVFVFDRDYQTRKRNWMILVRRT